MKRIYNYFSGENSVRGASILLIITLTLSNVLGLFRDRFLTKNIATYNLDIYYASFRIPDLIFNFLILGAITSAFIPVFSDFKAKNKLNEGFKVTSSLLNIAVIAMSFFAIILWFLMPHLMPLVVPSFDSYRMNQAITYSRLLMLTPIFFSVSYILGGVLNSFNRFFMYSLAPLFYNLSIIVGAYFLAPRYGLISVVYSVIAGSIIHALIQLPNVISLGFKYQFCLDFGHTAIKRIFRLMIPRTIGMGVNQLMLVAYTAIASSLAVGSISAFNLSNNIETMPVVALGTSFATAVFPTLTSKISENDREGFAFYFNRSMRSIAFLLIPSTIIFILLRAQIIRLILGSGKFGWDDTKKTAFTLGLFSVSLLAQGLIPLIARGFYALKNTRTPMYISIITVVVSVALGYPLSNYLGVAGLALAFSIGSFFNAIVLFYYLAKIYPDIVDGEVLFSYVKITIISLVMGAVIWGVMHIASTYVNMDRFVGVLEQTLVSLLAGLFTYFTLSYLFDSQEMKWALTRKIYDKNGKTT